MSHEILRYTTEIDKDGKMVKHHIGGKRELTEIKYMLTNGLDSISFEGKTLSVHSHSNINGVKRSVINVEGL